MKIDFNYNSDGSTWAGNYVAVDRHEDSGWAGRYLASDHHDDRQKQDVILRFCDAADNKAIAKGIPLQLNNCIIIFTMGSKNNIA